MYPYARILVSLVLVIVVAQVVEPKQGLLGGRNEIRDRNSKGIQAVADFATAEIAKKKLKNAEYDPKCTSLGYEVKKGTYQQVAGLKYELHLKVFPVVANTPECTAKQNSLLKNKWMPELCEVVVLVQSWKVDSSRLLRSVCLKIED